MEGDKHVFETVDLPVICNLFCLHKNGYWGLEMVVSSDFENKVVKEEGNSFETNKKKSQKSVIRLKNASKAFLSARYMYFC